VTTELTVVDGQTLTGRARLSNAARVGAWDVVVTDGATERVLDGAFEVLEGPPDLSDLYVGLQFDVTRTVNAETGLSTDVVEARAYFLVPLDPPCWPPDDCPLPVTVSAGPSVYLVGPDNTVTLERVVDPVTRAVTYEGRDLVLADYHFGTAYDVEAPGDADVGVPPFFLVDVQPTVPAPITLLSPAVQGLVIPRTADFAYQWTPAQTYPVAVLTASLGMASWFVWDDGQDVIPASELSALDPGSATFALSSYIEGEYFGLPFSSIQTCKSSSTFTLRAQVTLD
jgi:hypothetical protein